MGVLVAQSYPTLCGPMDCNPPGSSVHGILQARTLEWVPIPFSRGSSWPRDWPLSPALQADSLPSEPSGKPSSPRVDTDDKRQTSGLLEWASIYSTASTWVCIRGIFPQCREKLLALLYPKARWMNQIPWQGPQSSHNLSFKLSSLVSPPPSALVRSTLSS